ncbi:MAG: FAD-dependent monooxygenase [Gammaproteobacteria bacterium]|nr:FAD-dependent monooxygenase [Gammaproteobacteria bacterium]MBU2058196.1 FAD-dependent monooxygenase [Gammaproteobacteria bacterium]MBU2176973.1 FAD-dependent monooxygenase [Gammaproteobacteria bacterium]MBU2246586.1 FAD-dependent monooxygenase [Gammaproteobacteria bacterium]MBU2344953.1 FAD-dependent monooxygenase [Gammaproteobacteria bacterium]
MTYSTNNISTEHIEKKRIAIIGAGLAGSLLALKLSQQGYAVDVYERRSDPRALSAHAGRSINLGLSKRGMQALASVGLLEEVLKTAVVMRGRVIHFPDGSTKYQAYGKNDNEVLHSIDRNELNNLLLDHSEQYKDLKLHFNHKLVSAEKTKRLLEFSNEGRVVTVTPAWVIGADGAFSTMRKEMQYGERADYQQEYLEWGYKELTLEAGSDGQSVIELSALHVWPRNHCLFVSHPNLDGSHTLTLFLPFKGADSFQCLHTPADVRVLIDKYFPDLTPLLPSLLEQWDRHPVGALITTRTNQWSFEDWAVLVGDACHAVYPFFGQGMNSAFEDCYMLIALLAERPTDLATVFKTYEEKRRLHTDALAELSKQNFTELRQKVQSPWFHARKKLDVLLNKLFPSAWLPLYTMIAHTTIPYAEARERARRQDNVINFGSAAIFCLIGISVVMLLS